jgi:carboxyl-terminal processing protease
VDDNSPAALAGIKKGAVVTKLQDEAVNGTSFATLEGALGSQEKVLLTVEDAGQSNTIELTANTYSVVSAYGEMLQDAIGYIRVDEFNALTALQFKNAYNKLMQEGAAYIVFDLRNNAGGQLSAVTEMLDYLLPRGPYVSCKKKGETTVLKATDSYEVTVPTATLVNGNTVGEAELFAAVLQDFKKTSVVGTSTQGKAVMQEYFSMASDKGAVRLSTGTFYCIQSGENWQNTGVYPNKTADLSYELQSRFDLITKEEDTQLQAAITLLKNSHYVSLNNATTSGAVTTTSAQVTTTASQKK